MQLANKIGADLARENNKFDTLSRAENETPLGLTSGANPLSGVSEGERKRQFFKNYYKQYALSGEEGSMVNIAERSRSRSKRARLERAKQEAARAENQSLVDLMRSEQVAQTMPPNPVAMKQRYQFSNKTLHRSDSPDF